MKLPNWSNRCLLAIVTVAPVFAAASAAPTGDVATDATRAGWQRRAEAYDMEARFHRAAGKPAAAFLARRAAALGEAYRRRIHTGSQAGDQTPST